MFQVKRRLILMIVFAFSLLTYTNSFADCERKPLPITVLKTLNVRTVGELEKAIHLANTNGHFAILVEDGVYELNKLLIIKNDHIMIRSLSGNRDAVVLRGNGMHGNLGFIFLVQGRFFTVADMTIGWVKNHGIQIQGEKDADSPKIHNVHFVDTGEQMLKLSYDKNKAVGSDYGIVEWCTFEFSKGVGAQSYTGGIDAHFSKNWVVRNNKFIGIRSPQKEGLAEHAIHFWSGSQNTIVEKNIIINCDRGIGFGLGESGHSGGVIRNNMVHTTKDVGIGLENAQNAKVYNNVVFTENYPNSIEYRFPATSADIINNVVNLEIKQRSNGNANLENNIIGADAVWFKDPYNGNLELTAGVKSLIDRGKNLIEVQEDIHCKKRPIGKSLDIGAQEVDINILPIDPKLEVKKESIIFYTQKKVNSFFSQNWLSKIKNKFTLSHLILLALFEQLFFLIVLILVLKNLINIKKILSK